MPDQDGYPTDVELAEIRDYDVLHNPVSGLVALLYATWHWGIHDDWVTARGKHLYLATGGWSGNESIIGALKQNRLFWSMCWHKSMTGGAYWFHLEDAPNKGRGFSERAS